MTGTVWLFLHGFVPFAFSEEVALSSGNVVASTPIIQLPIPLPSIKNTAFSGDEFYRYDLQYEFIPAGEATLEVRRGELKDGTSVFHFVSNAESNKFIDVFFRVRDFNSSMVDAASLASLGFHQNLREGHYRVMRTTRINYSSGTYTYERTYKGKTKIREGRIGEPASDILSSFFYARTLPLELGKSYFIRVFSDGKTYSLKVEVDPKLRRVRVPAGKFECIRIRPYVVGDAIFKAKDGKMYIWLTNDERKMPVLIRSRVFIGAFDAELVEYEGP